MWCRTFRLAVILVAAVPSGVSAADFAARHGMTSGQYQAAFDQYTGQGYRLTTVDGYRTPNGVRYAAMWSKRGGPRWVARHGMNAGQYQSAFNQHTGDGYRPIDISATGLEQGSGTFAALWDRSPGAWIARHGLSSKQYQNEFDKRTQQGYRLVDVEGYTIQGGVRYAAVWVKRKGPQWRARHGMTSSKYQAAFDKATSQGFRLVKVDGYWTPSGVRYAAIWERRGGGRWVARHGMTSGRYQAEFNKYVGQGYRLTHVSGYMGPGKVLYAAIWSR